MSDQNTGPCPPGWTVAWLDKHADGGYVGLATKDGVGMMICGMPAREMAKGCQQATVPPWEKEVPGLTVRIKEAIEGTPCEIEYLDESGNLVGYWAYGSFDPGLPYQG